jgi:hypothetical protein
LCRMTTLPSRSLKKPMWQTLESNVSPMNSTPCASSSWRASATSATRIAKPAMFGWNSTPCSSGFQNESVTFGVSTWDAEHVAVERDRPLHVACRDGDEVDLLDLHGYGVLSVCGA